MKESDIVKSIMKYLKTVPGCFCWKEHGGMYGTAGIPDIIACINGHFFAFDVKTDSGKATKLQELWWYTPWTRCESPSAVLCNETKER